MAESHYEQKIKEYKRKFQLSKGLELAAPHEQTREQTVAEFVRKKNIEAQRMYQCLADFTEYKGEEVCLGLDVEKSNFHKR